MKKRIILQDQVYYRTYRDYLLLSDSLKENQQWKSPFQDNNVIYVMNVNSKTNKKHRFLDRLETSGGIFSKLDIKGDIEINPVDVRHFSITYRPEKIDPIYGHNYYSNGDLLSCKKLTINNPNGTTSFSVWPGSEEWISKDQLEDLELNAKGCSCSINNLPNLKKVKINNSVDYKFSKTSYGQDSSASTIRLEKCKSLELLDISKITEINNRTLVLKEINPDCKILFNKNTVLFYEIDDPSKGSSLKHFAEIESRDWYSSIERKVKLSTIFPDHIEDPIEITFKEFQYKMALYANNEILNFTKQVVALEQESFKKNFSEKPKETIEKKKAK